ncbi:hypothetical protein MHAS44199_02160 [Mycolicibacterium hassiacum DSM 44199]|nr:hypothetical protein [Mycolicibacterium hassiacum DSM 44199]
MTCATAGAGRHPGSIPRPRAARRARRRSSPRPGRSVPIIGAYPRPRRWRREVRAIGATAVVS